MKKNKVDIVNKLSELFSTTSSSNQSIDIDTFSSSDLVTDLGYDSLDLINFFFSDRRRVRSNNNRGRN